MAFGNNLTELRTKNNLTQEQLADTLGVTRQAVSKWEAGQSMPDVEKLVQLAKLFQVTVDELLSELNDKQNYCEKAQKKSNLYVILLFVFLVVVWLGGLVMFICSTCFAKEFFSGGGLLGKDIMQYSTIAVGVFFAVPGARKLANCYKEWKKKKTNK